MSLIHRPRRLRQTPGVRRLVAETRLSPADMVLPIFVAEGLNSPRPISSMPGVVHHSPASLAEAAHRAQEAGVGAIMPFGIPVHKDSIGSEATNPEGILATGVRILAEAVPEMPIIADLCLDEFTDSGHCGVLAADGRVDNDATLLRYQKMAVVMADAGATMIGTSGAMDGQVGACRSALDEAGHSDTIIMAYAAKYASAFYGPFQEAVNCSLQGDRKTYQQDPANAVEAIKEVQLDVDEGADIVMVKPGLPYLDILSQTVAQVPLPVASYVISGEYSMIEAAAAQGWISRKRAIMEALTCVKRAGASWIANYWATEVSEWLKEDR